MILKAYVLPHPPIVLPEIGRGEEKKIKDTAAAFHRAAREIAELEPDSIIICSSHSPLLRSAFYAANAGSAEGTMRAFGVDSIHEKVSYDGQLLQILQEVSQERDIALEATSFEAQTLDHGTLLPLIFIHKYYQNFKLLRLGMSLLGPEEHFSFGQAVAEAARRSNKRTVFIASGDLSHVLKADGPYGFREEGPQLDHELTGIFAGGDLGRLLHLDSNLVAGAQECGLRTFQIMAGVLAGSDFDSELYSYEGTFGVGYAVAAFSPKNKAVPAEDPYIKLARTSVETYIREGELLPTPQGLPDEMLQQQSGVFVTLYKDNNLRGCIGTIEPARANIAEEIIHNAVSAAKYDPRFPSVQSSELDRLVYSVDILGEKEEVASADALDPDRYGVIVSSGKRRGLLLPRLEGVSTAEDQLAIALIKAGLDPDKAFKIERFEVQRHERE